MMRIFIIQVHDPVIHLEVDEEQKAIFVTAVDYLVVYVPSISSIVLYSKFNGRVYVFPFRDNVFLPCDLGLEFYISLRENSINKY